MQSSTLLALLLAVSYAAADYQLPKAIAPPPAPPTLTPVVLQPKFDVYEVPVVRKDIPKAPTLDRIDVPKYPYAPPVFVKEIPPPPRAPELPKISLPVAPYAPAVYVREIPPPPRAPELPKISLPVAPYAPAVPVVKIPSPPVLPKYEVPVRPYPPALPKAAPYPPAIPAPKYEVPHSVYGTPVAAVKSDITPKFIFRLVQNGARLDAPVGINDHEDGYQFVSPEGIPVSVTTVHH